MTCLGSTSGTKCKKCLGHHVSFRGSGDAKVFQEFHFYGAVVESAAY